MNRQAQIIARARLLRRSKGRANLELSIQDRWLVQVWMPSRAGVFRGFLAFCLFRRSGAQLQVEHYQGTELVTRQQDASASVPWFMGQPSFWRPNPAQGGSLSLSVGLGDEEEQDLRAWLNIEQRKATVTTLASRRGRPRSTGPRST